MTRFVVLWHKFVNFLGFKKNLKKIPYGLYCYKFNGKIGKTEEGLPWYGTDVCPYYRSSKSGNVGCTYVGFYGWDPCLDDQCKICGERYDEPGRREKVEKIVKKVENGKNLPFS